uniref:Extracellular hemoglobin linker L2 subunit n=2 Tax=Lumbricus terrestris TaxID=6398 RepID=Q2I743_LUMTE|nr:Chain C1, EXTRACELLULAR HEMOGLOBIN LINKER L2 SUBUNIT [Lumbricus terrestris]4V93_C6 Chain C6, EXTRACELLULAR HEMOGLOBIN LINKER L2 SUBUNIT [Lumbricus terrestris]4V93_CD Chain CD, EXTRACELLULAR HEMOGLOBIN LINKER L2 SUBUNIT [Lumbricus terrestris]4V93_CI Chain CI, EXTRACELLULAR HEMOGLOBIN LINKER L2 SUBUNIT [Lumbricus terrestris]4V93_CN Chain CN, EXTRACELLULAR HEMOGLOBIN LINKER L2 SUBUNIT [Lumbricus terrestris]4V93_CS Chain CS, EXTRACELLULAR HEMOGLOBIN LINKER L2 SUBUNIT [Lumbricus terrestris]4V93
MLRLLLLSALSGLILADHHQPSGGGGGSYGGGGGGGGPFGRLFSDQLDPRLGANAFLIIRLDRIIEKLRTKLDEAEKIDPEHFVSEIDARVTKIEGTHCEKRTFQCGGNEQECISDLLVCDGHKDCHNAHDEDPDVCDTSVVKAGNVFSGTSTWHGCLAREDHVTRITITASKRRKFFTARIWLRALVESELERHGENVTSSFNAKGYYNFASRRLILLPTDDHDDHLAVVCSFNRGDNERAECHRVTEATLHQCADLFVTLEEHDDHDDHDDDHHDDHGKHHGGKHH